jgi:hypothetical protein
MSKESLKEMSDEDLMELERLLVSAENALKQKKPMTEEEIPEAEPVYQIAMAEGSTSTAWIDVAKDVFDDAGMYPEYKRRALYTRPSPARKPMTEDEVGEEILRNADEWSRNFANGFVLGVRFAEKHHGISGEDQ